MESYLYFYVLVHKKQLKNLDSLNLKNQLVRAGVGCLARKYGEVMKAMAYRNLNIKPKNSTLSNLQHYLYEESDHVLLLIAIDYDCDQEYTFYKEALIFSRSNVNRDCEKGQKKICKFVEYIREEKENLELGNLVGDEIDRELDRIDLEIGKAYKSRNFHIINSDLISNEVVEECVNSIRISKKMFQISCNQINSAVRLYSFKNLHKIWLNRNQFEYFKKINDEKKSDLRLKFSTIEIDTIFNKINEMSEVFTPRSILTRINSAFRRTMTEDELAVDDRLINDMEILILNNDLNDYDDRELILARLSKDYPNLQLTLSKMNFLEQKIRTKLGKN